MSMRTLVIGAGAAGITAAHLLVEQGLEVDVLEATDRHGGRVKKTEAFGVPLDVGAEWIHTWIDAKPTFALPLLAGTDPEIATLRDNRPYTRFHLGGRLWHLPFLKYVPMPRDNKFRDSSWFDVIDRLVKPELQARIHYETPVETIRYGDTGVRVTAADGRSFEGDRVIVTVPIKILQSRAIRFEPPLPTEKWAAIDEEEMPDGLKVFIEFSERFYPDTLLMAQLFGADRQGDCMYYDAMFGRDTDRHVLGLFAQGPKAKKYVQHDDDAVIEFILAELDAIFDGAASRSHLGHVVQNWSTEPFTRGSYSQRKGDAKALAASVGGRVFFAGEAMNPTGHTIAVHGACEAAYHAVEELLEGVEQQR